MIARLVLAGGLLLSFASSLADDQAADAPRELRVRPTRDFAITGDGSAPSWEQAEWFPLHVRDPASETRKTRVKVMHSPEGIYVLMDAEDSTLTSTIQDDFADLWNEDVFEFFLRPDDRDPIYFEYEISPLGRELPILVPNLDGKFLGWRPWHYEGGRKVRKATSAVGGVLASGSKVGGWKAEVFVPFELLAPMRNVPPKAGSRWKANFYRLDYDGGTAASWDWSRVGRSFHDVARFGTLVFE